MYAVSPVEKVDGKSKNSAIDNADNEPRPWVDDYLGRNKSVVAKNIKTDKLSESELKELLDHESNDKNRNKVINEINKRLK